MAYTALYRNYRPIKFSEIVGQDHITKTLKNQVMVGRVGHAYLFTGGRGTGKTTSAKILARAVNCLNPKDGEPCNECENCIDILNGSSTDVIEMDAASNNGVEEIRTIREEVNFLPTKGKYRVYIIDEVHMLSQGASNALLKTLEEPPEHVKFILATTEPQKMIATILSRCQRFDFKNISNEDIIKRLKIICDDAKIKITDRALEAIAVLSEGHMRDAISVLERCSQESTEEITDDLVKDLVGIPKVESISRVVKAIVDSDTKEALNVLDEITNSGKDLYNFMWEIIKYVKDVLVFKTTGEKGLYSPSEVEQIEEISSKLSEKELLNYIYELSELENNLKWATQKTIMFQTGLIKLCQKGGSTVGVPADLIARIEALEKKVEELEKGSTELHIPANNPRPIIEKQTIKKEKTDDEKDPVKATWKRVLEKLKRDGKVRLFAALANAKVSAENDLIWNLEFPRGLAETNKRLIEDSENKAILEKDVYLITGKEVHFKVKEISEKKVEENRRSIDSLGFDVNVIDE